MYISSHQCAVKINVLAPVGIWNDYSLLLHMSLTGYEVFETFQLVQWTQNGGKKRKRRYLEKKGAKVGLGPKRRKHKEKEVHLKPVISVNTKCHQSSML